MRGISAWDALAQARRANAASAGRATYAAAWGGQSRRAFLQAMAASAAIRPSPSAAFAAPSGPVAIIGGGIAGLSALWRLNSIGVDARLYEARARLGGRMLTARAAGDHLEIGGQFVNTDHSDMQALAKAFDISLIDRKVERSASMLIVDGRVIPESEAIEALRPIAAQIAADADRLDEDYVKAGAQLDRLSFSDYLKQHGDKIPVAWVARLLEATARTEYGVEPEEASAIELVFNLPTVKGDQVEVLGASDERYLIDGGSSTLIEAMAARLHRKISTDRTLLAVERLGRGVRLHFADTSTVDAPHVVIATPAGVTRRIRFASPLPSLWRRFTDEVQLGRCEKVLSAMNSKPWQSPVGTGGEIWPIGGGSDVSEGWDGSVRRSATETATWTWYLGGAQVATASGVDAVALAKRFASRVEPGAPGMIEATKTAYMTGWQKEPLTAGAYVNYRPGQLTRFASLFWIEEGGRVESPPLSAGPITFAGEHLSDAFPGYMNGAAQTGRLAADTVARRLFGSTTY